jgi:hypothetical protein
MFNDWFHSVHSNSDLRRIIAQYSQEVQGSAKIMPVTAQRCTLANELEKLDRIEQHEQDYRESHGY